MDHKPVPWYYGLRIYLFSTILYFFLVIPFLTFIAIQRVPDIAEKSKLAGGIGLQADSLGINADSVMVQTQAEIDSIAREALARAKTGREMITPGEIDTLLQKTMYRGKPVREILSGEQIDSMTREALVRQGIDSAVADSALQEAAHQDTTVRFFEEKGPFERYFQLLFLLILVSYLAGFLYNRPFKRYFRQKRKKRTISQKLHAFCKKQLLNTPVVNSLILTMPNVVVIIYSLVFIISENRYQGDIEKDLFIQFFYITLVATLLEFLFVYFWWKHRVHIKYIEHIFSEQELRSQVFRRKKGKIRDRLLMASGMTTFLPLLVVLVYLILSLTSIGDLELDTITPEQREILIGPIARFMNPDQGSVPAENYEKLFYVNAVDSIIMLVGIATGIMASLIYLLLFIKWTNQDITGPVKELLASIRKTRGGETEHYTIVRTNDEIGELAEGYNEMTGKIHEYLENISRMNRELEQKVEERTREVVMQKEEIEAQKEEIEAQLDLTTQQRDTITRQKDQILDSIIYAERIQSAILPPTTYLSEFLEDFFIIFRPRDIVSGDYYWTTRKNEKLMIAVADCTGHGVPGAFLSMLGISYMNEIVNRNDTIHANQILEKLRDFVINSLHQTGARKEARDGIEIALCIIHPKEGILEFSGANRPLYLIREKGKTDHGHPESKRYELIQVKGDRMPIGIYEQEALPFTNHEIPFRKNDSLYLFSDGYVDQLGGPDRKTFRSRYFRKLLLEIQDRPMEVQKKILIERLEAWQGDVEQIDDILVMGLRF
ncbi:MAG: SpoIIE family protein phosphatase [Bacteroidales bacterium]